MFERILVPLDGSGLAEQVIPPVAELARAFASQVTVLAVCEPGNAGEEQSCRQYTAGIAARLAEGFSASGSGASAVAATVSGKPAEQVVRYASATAVDLIAMTSHARSGITPWPGTTAQHVLRKASVPLIVARPGQEGQRERLFDRIVVPLDGSERSQSVLPYLAELAKRLPCEITLFRVTEPGRHVRTIGGLDYIRYDERDMAAANAKSRDYLERLRAGRFMPGNRVSSEVRSGDAAQEILKLADETKCTLLAMSSHGHSGIEAWALGSVSSKVLHLSRHSVFLVPSFLQRDVASNAG